VARILIIDDSSFMRKRIGNAVRQAGHEVIGTAREGAEGFEMYRELRPDLVIMDITMQGVDGIQAAGMIRHEDPEAKIVFMSLVTDPDVMCKAQELGALDFLGKNDSEKLSSIMDGLEK